jgi:anti-anti-sigma regulatory factor
MTGEPLDYSFHQGPLTLHVRGGGSGDRRMEARGRIDGATCHALRAILLAEIEQGSLVLDGSAVDYCTGPGVRALCTAAAAAVEHEQSFRITTSSSVLTSAFERSATDAPPNLFDAAG